MSAYKTGEKVQWIVGQPGPDLDRCEVIADDGGETVKIKFQVYRRGKFQEADVKRSLMTKIPW